MSNGDCHVGAANMANILSTEKRVKAVEKRMSTLESKQEWMLRIAITTLVAVIINWFI